MSGFIAICDLKENAIPEKLLRSLLGSLAARGPDAQNIWMSGSIGLGHTLFRTSNEAQYEKQPASIDGKVWISSSARIDGREQLVGKLGLKNRISLDQTPDSELILHAYSKWGEACLDHLIGDFAFVIWDSREGKIFCARDHFGSRQLYFTHKKDSFVVSNSISCMLQHPDISRRLDDKAMGGFLLFGDHCWVDKSITAFADVATLPPAHKLVFKKGRIFVQRYWDIPAETPMLRYRTERDYIEHFLDVFQTCVADRLRTPSIAVAMSGGLDSTAIAATVCGLRKQRAYSETEIHAVTGLHEQLMGCEERHYAGLVASHLNIPIHFISGDTYPALKSGFVTTRPMEILVPEYWLDFKKNVLSHARVQLTGAAADNLFSYSPAISTLKEVNPFHVLSDLLLLRKRYGKMPSIGTGLHSMLRKTVGKKQKAVCYPYPSWLNPEFERIACLKDLWNEVFSTSSPFVHPRHPRAYDDLVKPGWNTDDVAFRTDVALPEERDPYLDLRLLGFVFSLPSVPWFYNKHLLRGSMKGLLPNEVIDRPKNPLGNLQSRLLQQAENNWVDSWKARPELEHYIRREEIPSVLHGQPGNEDEDYINLRPLILNSWIDGIKS